MYLNTCHTRNYSLAMSKRPPAAPAAKTSRQQLPQSKFAVNSFKPGNSWHGDLFLELLNSSVVKIEEINGVIARAIPPPLTLQ